MVFHCVYIWNGGTVKRTVYSRGIWYAYIKRIIVVVETANEVKQKRWKLIHDIWFCNSCNVIGKDVIESR